MIISIIDDNDEQLKLSTSLIENEIQKYTNNYIIDKFNDPLIFDMSKYYDVLFLEIKMSKDGIELAKDYLIKHRKTKIIFISKDIERIYDIFDVHPFYFIKKNNLELIITKVIKSLFDKIEINTNYLTVNTKDGFTNILLNSIKYIKSNKHYCSIFTVDKIYVVRDTIDNIFSKINNNNFSRIHRSTIINWSHVKEFKYSTIKIEQDYLSVSRTYIYKCKQAYENFISGINK